METKNAILVMWLGVTNVQLHHQMYVLNASMIFGQTSLMENVNAGGRS